MISLRSNRDRVETERCRAGCDLGEWSRARRTAWTTLLACFLIAPATAWANSFQGLGIFLAAIMVGVPCLLVETILVVVGAILGRSRAKAGRGRRVFARISVVLSPLLVVFYVAAALFLEGNLPHGFEGHLLLSTAPLVFLGYASMHLAVRILKREAKLRGE